MIVLFRETSPPPLSHPRFFRRPDDAARSIFMAKEEPKVTSNLKVTEAYGEDKIQILEGLEAVRKRPRCISGTRPRVAFITWYGNRQQLRRRSHGRLLREYLGPHQRRRLASASPTTAAASPWAPIPTQKSSTLEVGHVRTSRRWQVRRRRIQRSPAASTASALRSVNALAEWVEVEVSPRWQSLHHEIRPRQTHPKPQGNRQAPEDRHQSHFQARP